MFEENRFERFWRKCRRSLKRFSYYVVILIILVLLLELGSFVIIFADDLIFGNVDPRIKSKVYEGKEWTEEYWQEFSESYKAQYYPYLGHSRVPFNGKFINVDENSVRKTFQCKNFGNDLKIFVFGGSTVWGTGVRDDGTIPSFIAKKICPTSITNFGESGYTSTQELIKLQLELRRGNIPDIVIFYDGINDVHATYQIGIAGFPQNVQNRIKDFNLHKKNEWNLLPYTKKIILNIISNFQNKRIIDDSQKLNRETAEIYLNNIKIIKLLGKEFDFKTYFYWQPIGESDYQFAKSYLKISNIVIQSEDVIDLTDIFNDNSMYIDDYHVSEEGNEIIARKIIDDIMKISL